MSPSVLSPWHRSEERDSRQRAEERVGHLGYMIETIDLLYDAFLRRRLSPEWSAELERMQRWLQREERGRLAEAG